MNIAIDRRWIRITTLALVASLFSCLAAPAADRIVYEGKAGPGVGKQVVLIAGDEEYRSEEYLPLLGKILAVRNGFKCTVLFAVDPDGTINPNNLASLPGAEVIATADVLVLGLRFRNWPDEQMKCFVDAYLAGKPIVAIRTSTHAFKYDKNSASPYRQYSFNSTEWKGGFGRQVLGETWVAHHGVHKKEATRGVFESASKDDPILRGITEIFGNTDVYTASPPEDVKVLVRGQVLTGMNPTDPPVDGPKNNPMQPVAWTRLYKNEAGKTNKIFTTTMGAGTDFENEGLRRLVVNAVYWAAGLEVPAKADVAIVGEYTGAMYGFNGYKKGVKPEDHALK